MPYRFEEDHLDRKERKQERKTLRQKDRSKYKKTDASKKKGKEIETDGLFRGRVLAVLPEEISVEREGVVYACNLKGALKQERGRVKNLCVVGDFVLFDASNGIVHIEERQTLLSRRDPSSTHKMHILASNIDQVLITISVMTPPLKPSLIDRFMIATHKGGMKPVLLLTKVDLLDGEKDLFLEVVTLYRRIGVPVIPISTVTGAGLEELKMAMTTKASVFAGESGVGKSSLINAITGLDLETQEVARKTQRGIHTTVSATLIPLPCGGWCIDTPGIQSFGLWDLQREDLIHYFEEISTIGLDCKYPNCSHVHEPKCAVLHALEKGELSKLRYESYVILLQEVKDKEF